MTEKRIGYWADVYSEATRELHEASRMKTPISAEEAFKLAVNKIDAREEYRANIQRLGDLVEQAMSQDRPVAQCMGAHV